MKIKEYLKNKFLPIGIKIVSNNIGSSFTYYMDKFHPFDHGAPEKIYKISNDYELPIYSNYRYSIKLGWTNFKGLAILSALRNFNLLNSNELDFFSKAIGTRTIELPTDEINSVTKSAINRSKNLFLYGTENTDGLPDLMPKENDVNSTINLYKQRHVSMFQKLAAVTGYNLPEGADILEIGYISGGYSIQAFEKLGFKSTGIDNFYGGISQKNNLHSYIKKLTNSKARLLNGDITNAKEIKSETFDLIYSVSVLEHIQDLESAFAEMHRLLKPGGAIIHNYHPYFSHDGGHALGIGDSPWAHVLMDQTEYINYLREYRPFESEAALDWIKNGLHRDVPQSKMQQLLSQAGFQIRIWNAKSSNAQFLSDLSPEIIKECFIKNPGISIQDLTSQSVSFLAMKLC